MQDETLERERGTRNEEEMTPTRRAETKRNETRRDETRQGIPQRDANWNGDGSAHAGKREGGGGEEVKQPIREVTFCLIS